MTDLLIGGAVTIVSSLITYWIGSNKSAAEVRKLNAEAEQIELDTRLDEVELFEKINKVLSEQNEKNEAYIRRLEQRISELEILIENLDNNQCLGDACLTKQAYDKIIAKRAARKKKTTTE